MPHTPIGSLNDSKLKEGGKSITKYRANQMFLSCET